MASKAEREIELKDPEKYQRDLDRYHRALHAMQTGVAYEHDNGSDDGTPKHLRVGVNSRAVDHTALVGLLVAKGLFTWEEYMEALADEAEREVGRYELRINERLTRKTGRKTNITLG